MNENLMLILAAIFEVAVIFMVIALLVEAIVEILKSAIPVSLPDWADVLVAIILACYICIYYQLDFLFTIGVSPAVTIVGMILTGVLISRGANYLHDKVLEPISKFGGKF